MTVQHTFIGQAQFQCFMNACSGNRCQCYYYLYWTHGNLLANRTCLPPSARDFSISNFSSTDYKYHAFIIYSNEDKLWMKRKLLPLLEERHHLTCCVHYRDFFLGWPFRDNMAYSVYTSYKVIVLFSSNFLKSNYCKYEMDIAINRLIKKQDNSLVAIRIDRVDLKELPCEIKHNSCIDYIDVLERPLWRRRLLNFLDVPEDSQNVTGEQNSDNNNINGYKLITNDITRGRPGFARLNSTTSNDSEISYV